MNDVYLRGPRVKYSVSFIYPIYLLTFRDEDGVPVFSEQGKEMKARIAHAQKTEQNQRFAQTQGGSVSPTGSSPGTVDR